MVETTYKCTSGADKYLGDNSYTYYTDVDKYNYLGDNKTYSYHTGADKYIGKRMYPYTDYTDLGKYKYLGGNTYTGYSDVGKYNYLGDNKYTYHTDVDKYKYSSGGDNYTYYTGPGGDRYMYGTGESYKYTDDPSLVPIHKSSKVTQVFEHENTIKGSIKTSSTATYLINGKRVTTNKETENGQETVEVYEDGVLKKRTVSGVPKAAGGDLIYRSKLNYTI